jgi:hypothetical protein
MTRQEKLRKLRESIDRLSRCLDLDAPDVILSHMAYAVFRRAWGLDPDACGKLVAGDLTERFRNAAGVCGIEPGLNGGVYCDEPIYEGGEWHVGRISGTALCRRHYEELMKEANGDNDAS